LEPSIVETRMKNKKMILAECEATLSNGAEPNKNISRTEFCKKLDFVPIVISQTKMEF